MADPAARPPGQKHRIVIVGGGVAGLELATRLGNGPGRAGRAEIVLVEKRRTHLWKPLLHAVAAGSMDPSAHELNYLAQAHWHHFSYRLGEMVGLDRGRREVLLGATLDDEGREITPARAIPYDTLVLAVGSVTNDFGTPGVAEFAVPLETPQQAARFNRRLVNACIHAHVQEEPIRPGQLHVAIIGAGATGTELAAEIHRTAREVVTYGLDRVQPERDIRIILIEAAPRVLPALPERLSTAVAALLGRLGVEVRTGAQVAAVDAHGVTLAGGAFLPAELVVWCAGVKGPECLAHLDGLEVTRSNQLVVEPTLATTRDPAIFAMGDCASCPDGHGGRLPPRAQAAHQQAAHLVRSLRGRLAGRPPSPFVYRDFGSLVSLGKFSTVGNLMGVVIGRSFFVEGLMARLMYRSLYFSHESALYGPLRATTRALARAIFRHGGPVVKLH